MRKFVVVEFPADCLEGAPNGDNFIFARLASILDEVHLYAQPTFYEKRKYRAWISRDSQNYLINVLLLVDVHSSL